jgi:hypothetical protein
LSRGQTTFRQRDLCAAIKAVTAAGCVVARVEVDKTGKITVIVAGKDQRVAVDCKNEWDDLS